MALSSTDGPYMLWTRNDQTGQFDFTWDSTGNPTFTSDRSEKIISLLAELRGSWWADEFGDRGSNVWKIKNEFSTTASEIRAEITDALQPLVDSKEIVSFSVDVKRIRAGKYNFEVFWSEPDGEQTVVRMSI